MGIESTKKVEIDLYTNKVITINAKQDDVSSRNVLITCYDQGKQVVLDPAYSVYIRYKKPDGTNVISACSITDDGKIYVELTEQMLIAPGTCYSDLLIFDKEDSCISTMEFRIRVIPSIIDGSDLESADDYLALNKLMLMAQKNYLNVIEECKEQLASMQAICDNLGGVFSPQGTITFSELSSSTKAPGLVYHIRDQFVTDDSFKCGAGVTYPPGTSVYYTADGYWDCFIGETLSVTDDGDGNVTINLVL